MTHKVYIALPCHSGQVMFSTVDSLFTSCQEASDAGWPHPFLGIRAGDADLIACRNGLIGHFLESDCTDILMVDSDISWGPEVFTRIVSHAQDFVCGAYRQKKQEEFYPLVWPDKKQLWVDPATDFPLVAVARCPVGFARLTRSCVEKMVGSLEVGDWYIEASAINNEEAKKIPWLFDFVRIPKAGDVSVRIEEGFGLCRRWEQMGGTVWLDPAINLGHAGLKIFEGDISGRIAAEVLYNRQFAA